MEVKIRDKIYNSNVEPIMIMLTETEKNNVADMMSRSYGKTYDYCVYPDSISVNEAEEFMQLRDNK